ncbi:MAG: ABC transporter permease subunit [Defluviitaleaceae bacterium]|nr:ABC transporter permease subunit [Defluviitaleaceae bacterium]MCL2239736.1 ABC transporter permease subunit [Defluviitaleaceae bacterium]
MAVKASTGSRFARAIRRYWILYLMCIPGALFFLLFRYGPMWGILVAFQDYNIWRGFWDSDWVGVAHFTRFFTGPHFRTLMTNTLWLSFLGIVFAFPAPIVLALFLNELRLQWFKRTIQTMIYVPHFISWVIIGSMTFMLLSSGGPINSLLGNFGIGPIPFLISEGAFRPIMVIQGIWRGAGFGTIIFLAALSSVDMEQYEAAIVDGAGRFRQCWHITLPALRSVVVLLLILQMGSILDTNFDQVVLLSNAGNRSVSDVIETFVFREGLLGGNFSFTTAIGLFQSIIGLVLVVTADRVAKAVGQSGLF